MGGGVGWGMRLTFCEYGHQINWKGGGGGGVGGTFHKGIIVAVELIRDGPVLMKASRR